MAARATNRRRRISLLAAALTVLAVVPGCFTGERPTLAEGPLVTGDPAVDDVLARLDVAARGDFSADYEVLTRFGSLTTPARVVQEGSERRSITVGDLRFLVEGSSTATCDLASGDCTSTIDVQRISDTQITPDFYASSAAARLRRDAELRTGPTTAAVETIAGQPAMCVTVPVEGGQSNYCALDSGPLARDDAADLLIEMTAWSATVDESAFTRPS